VPCFAWLFKMSAATATNSVLASIFVLSLLMMFLIPFTLCVAAALPV
jgi:hypothetical protein